MDGYSHAGEPFGDKVGRGDAAFQEARRKRVDEGLCGGIVLANEFAAHQLDTEKLGGLEAELLPHFFADAAESVSVELDF